MSLEPESAPRGDGIPGLRERKKRRTRETISEAAVNLFVRHGFDQVSVSDVAAAAEVSKVTVFNYFPTKEDLVLSRLPQHLGSAADDVRTHGQDESALQALRRGYLQRLAARDPSTGLSGDEEFLAVQNLISTTPTLTVRLTHHLLGAERTLAAALADYLGEPSDSLLAGLAACQLLSLERSLVERNLVRMLSLPDPEQHYPNAVSEAEYGYSVVAAGLAGAGL